MPTPGSDPVAEASPPTTTSDELSSKNARVSRFVLWLIALLVISPIAITLAIYHLPESAQASYVDLAGPWKVHAGKAHGLSRPGTFDDKWPTLNVPGRFSRQGYRARDLWLRKHFRIPAALRGKDLYVVLGELRGAQIAVYVNGHHIGEQGTPDQYYRQRRAHAGLLGWRTPAATLVPGDNVVTLHVRRGAPYALDGVLDSTCLIGERTYFKWHVYRYNTARRFFAYGSVVLLLFLAGMIAFLLRLEWATADRWVYLSCIFMVLACAGYVADREGLAFAFIHAPRQAAELRVFYFFSTLIGMTTWEYTEHYFLRRVTLLRKIVRVLFLAALPAYFVLDPDRVYQFAILLLFATMVYAVYLVARDLMGHQRSYTVMFLIGATVCILTGLNDMLGDLDLIKSPRLFTLGAAGFGILATTLVIGDFLRLSERNKALTRRLTTTNVDLERAMLAAQQSARVQGAFLANTSHELRTPLNTIINLPPLLLRGFERSEVVRCGACGALFELEDDSDDGVLEEACPDCGQDGSLSRDQALLFSGDSDRAVRSLRAIETSGRHLLRLVDDILDHSKLEAGTLSLQPSEVEVVPLLEELVFSMTPLLERQNVIVDHSTIQAGATIHVDRDRLRQVLVNLLSNAVKFSPPESTVSLDAELQEQIAVFSVRDQGIGIDDKDRDLVFEAFRQVEDGHTRRFGGAGLGLSIARGLVELQGGSIWFESDVGSGTTFFFTLPAKPTQGDGPPAHREETPA